MTVLTVITRESSARPLADLGFQCARALETRLVVVCLASGPEDGPSGSITPGEPLPEGIHEAAAEACRALERSGEPLELAPADDEPPTGGPLLADPEVEIRWRTTPHRLRTVLAELADCQAELLLAAHHTTRSGGRGVPLARKLFTAAPCHTVLVRLGDAPAHTCRRILVPTAGGPHAEVALYLGERLASAADGELVALYVLPDEGELAPEVGVRILSQALRDAGVADSRRVRPQVTLGSDHEAVIAVEADRDFDLLLLGESNAGTLRRKLFGTVPDRLLAGEGGLRVAVVRREWKLLHRLRRRLGRWLDLAIPQMTREERIALYEKLHSGSEWNFDFMALIGLSTAIASLGLLQSSTAVVIGAMLVAPLMTPILGAGLALVQGNLPLLRSAVRAIAYGYWLAFLIGFALGYASGLEELTPELAARGGPTLLDMGVGFLSGLAAAYCLARPGLLAALPGVAIAAALVPPIATTGVSLALALAARGHGPEAAALLELAREARENGQGAAVLFATNVVAIILGAAVSLYAGGMRGKRGASSRQRWARWLLLALLLGAVALAVHVAAPR